MTRRLASAARALFALLVLYCAALAPGHAAVRLDEGSAKVTIGAGVEYLEDADHTLPEGDVLGGSSALDWKRGEAAIFNQGYSSSVWWLRFEVENAAERSDWLLVLDYPVLDDIRVWQLEGTAVQAHWTLGDDLPFHARPVLNRAFVLPVSLPPGSTTSFVMRVVTDSSVQLPMALWTPQAFDAAENRVTLLQGAYFGALLIIAVHNLLLYFTLREAAYLYYVGYVSNMMLFGMSIGGWAYQYLWPRATVWNDQVIIVSLGLAMFFGNRLITRFLSRALGPGAERFDNLVASVAITLVAASFVFPYALLIRLLVPFAALISLWGVSVAMLALARRVPTARWYVASWSVLLSGTIVFVMDKYGILPRSVATDQAVQVGVVLQIVLVSLALAERINDERAMRLQAQREALETQRLATSRLESRVMERTRELESANARLEELSATDQLTGLRNRRYLEEHFRREFARAMRHRRPIAVMLLDVDHFKQVNDVHGHLVGDECLREVGRRIQSVLRGSDLVARYGGEEFCLVLTEPSAEGAMRVAERILEAIASAPIVAADTLELTVTASIGCRVGVPDAACSPHEFLQGADEALYASKANGRARVTLAEHEGGGGCEAA